ncbi:MAG: FHA domain-containing protein, partial [Planctomycetota bacterium]
MMRLWYNNVVDTQRRVLEIEGDRISIGRGEQNDLVLASPYIASEAVVLYRRDAGWEVVVLGSNGIKIGDRQLTAGEHCELVSRSAIEIFPFTITIDLPSQEELSSEAERKRLDQQMSQLIAETHRELLDRMDLRRGVDPSKHQDDVYLMTLEQHIETIVRDHPTYQSQPTAPKSMSPIAHLAGSAVRDRMLRQVSGTTVTNSKHSLLDAESNWSRIVTSVPEREKELDSTVTYLARILGLDQDDMKSGLRIEAIQQDFWSAWEKIHESIHAEFKDYLALRMLKKEIKDIVFGYGPLEDLLRMKSISEIMVVDRDHIFVESSGVIEDSGRRFISDDVVESIIQRIVGKVGRRIDKSQPLVDARLED